MRLVFMGTPDFAVPALDALAKAHEVVLVVCQPDRPKGRKKRLQAPPVKERALEMELRVEQPPSMRKPEVWDLLRQCRADLAVVVAYGKILPPEVLTIFPHGCINIHGSLLPKYRGAAPIQWAVLDNEPETGVSIMQLDEGMDTGPVFFQERVEIGSRETSGQLFERLAPLGAKAVVKVIEDIEANRAEAIAQDESKASHARMLTKSDGEVDFDRQADDLAAWIRGMDPWPGAFVRHGGENYKLFGAQAGEASGGAIPGTLLEIVDRSIRVACEDGSVVIEEIQAPGKKRVCAADFVRGRRVAEGAPFFVSTGAS